MNITTFRFIKCSKSKHFAAWLRAGEREVFYLMKSKKSRKKWLLSLMVVMGIFLAGVYAVACGGEKQAEKLRDLEFAVIGPDETPQELAQIIEEKKNDSFRLTYTSGNDLYIAAGYGKQETGGYSITVPELYLTDNSIIVKTELKGPERSEPTGEEPSYPYIVLRTELHGGTSGIPVVSYETKKTGTGESIIRFLSLCSFCRTISAGFPI